VARGREPAHIDADLGDDDLRCQVTDAWDGAQQADRLAERVEVAVHLRVDLGDGGAQRVELPQVQAQQEAVPHGDTLCANDGFLPTFDDGAWVIPI